ncbi:MAG: 2Fe-2S iron-sulfur cluster-binding protein [Actinomycetota bacterium]|nr:2Fe-2S iron-sulfur cluster-binding protein [Actinomycetota bacterium]
MSETVVTTVNGRVVETAVEANELLLDFLRDRLGLIGARQSCEVQVCGTCTVLVDGMPVSSCTHLACDVDGKEVETIEGLVGTPLHDELSDAFVRHAAVQCGFCTPGMLLTAKALLGTEDVATEEGTRRAMAGNLCRCTGYRSILDALTEVFDAHRTPRS